MVNNRKSLDPRWSKHHAPVVVGFHTCEVTITRRVQGVPIIYDETTKKYNSGDVYKTVYSGTARIQPYGINLDMEVANDPTARRLVLAQLKGTGLEITNDDVMVVTACADNPDLMNYRYDIRGSIGGSAEWGTNLVVEANLKQQLNG